MLYIVTIIHGLTSYGYLQVNSRIISVLLFEMPLMFFISGASMTIAPFKPMKSFIVSRIKRVVVPYFVWGIIAFVILLLKHSDVTHIKDIILVNNISVLPYCNQLWFIKPYLIVSVLGYILLTAIYTAKNSPRCVWVTIGGGKVLIYTMLLVIEVLISFTDNFLSFVIGYLFFFIMGFLYRKWTHIDFFICIFSLVPLLLLHKYGIYSFVMQENKFPPNVMFVLYGTIMVAVVVELSKTKLIEFLTKVPIIQRWNKYGYEIYLYQNFAFWITWHFMNIVSEIYVLPSIVHYSLSVVTIVILLSIVSPLVHRINNIIISKIYVK